MLNDDISWLSDPQTQYLFMQFPLPLAIVGSDGSIKQLNQSFTNTFDTASLESESLQKVLHDHSHSPVSLDCNGCATTVFVRTVNVGDNTLLVLEKSSEFLQNAAFTLAIRKPHHAPHHRATFRPHRQNRPDHWRFTRARLADGAGTG